MLEIAKCCASKITELSLANNNSMPILSSAEQELAIQEFLRDRDNLTNLYTSQVTLIQDGLRGVSDKQFNLNIALATISAAVIGVVIPLVSSTDTHLNRNLFWWAIGFFGGSLLSDLVTSFGAIYYDRWALKNQFPKLNDFFRKLLDSTNNLINKARSKSLTIEEIIEHYDKKKTASEEYAKLEKQWIQKWLDAGYYLFILAFIIGLVLIVFAFLPR